MKLNALTPIEHDAKRYSEGDTLNVEDKAQAKALIDCGAAEAVGKPKSEAKSDEGPGDQSQA